MDAIRDTFIKLNPYDSTAVEESVVELEAENYVDGERAELLCYAISAKRYASTAPTSPAPCCCGEIATTDTRSGESTASDTS